MVGRGPILRGNSFRGFSTMSEGNYRNPENEGPENSRVNLGKAAPLDLKMSARNAPVFANSENDDSHHETNCR
jgi:hypothetical protein